MEVLMEKEKICLKGHNIIYEMNLIFGMFMES